MKVRYEVKIIDGGTDVKAWVAIIKEPSWWNIFSKRKITKERLVCNRATGFHWVGEYTKDFDVYARNFFWDELKKFRRLSEDPRPLEISFDF